MTAPDRARSLAPWLLSAVLGVLLAVALVALSRQGTRIDGLEQQVGAGAATPAVSTGSDRMPAPMAPVPATGSAPGSPSTAPEAALKPSLPRGAPLAISEADRRAATLDELEDGLEEAEEQLWGVVGPTLDALVGDGALDGGSLDAVEAVLLDELHQTWEIKAAVVRGELTDTEGWLEYQLLRRDTDAALGAYLEPDDLVRLRPQAGEAGGGG